MLTQTQHYKGSRQKVLDDVTSDVELILAGT